MDTSAVPREIWFEIFKYLDRFELDDVHQSGVFEHVLQDEKFWLFYNQFNNVVINKRYPSVYEFYRDNNALSGRTEWHLSIFMDRTHKMKLYDHLKGLFGSTDYILYLDVNQIISLGTIGRFDGFQAYKRINDIGDKIRGYIKLDDLFDSKQYWLVYDSHCKPEMYFYDLMCGGLTSKDKHKANGEIVERLKSELGMKIEFSSIGIRYIFFIEKITFDEAEFKQFIYRSYPYIK